MSYFLFAVKYNLGWRRLLYIAGLTIFVHILIDGPKVMHPVWSYPGFYLLSWMAVVAVDTILKRFLRNWPKNEA